MFIRCLCYGVYVSEGKRERWGDECNVEIKHKRELLYKPRPSNCTMKVGWFIYGLCVNAHLNEEDS